MNVGWLGLAVTLLLVAILVGTGVNPWWRLLVFFPATLSASGFIQARLHFCAGFARLGIYNFSAVGQKHAVPDETSNAKDKKRGNQIMIYAMLFGVAVAIACVFL